MIGFSQQSSPPPSLINDTSASQAKRDLLKNYKKSKRWPNFFIGVNAGVVSGLGTYRDWGYLDGFNVNGEMGSYVFSHFALIGKWGLYYLTVDNTMFDLAFRNEYHLSNEFTPDISGWHQDLTPFYLSGGFKYIIPIKRFFFVEIKALVGIQFDFLSRSQGGSLSRPYYGGTESYSFDRRYVSGLPQADFPVNCGVAVRYKIYKGLNAFLNAELLYARENVIMYVGHDLNNVYVNSTEYTYKQTLLVSNIGIGVIFIFDKRQW